jgi:hypothetical protein
MSVPCTKPEAALPTVTLVTLRWCAVPELTGWLVLEVPWNSWRKQVQAPFNSTGIAVRSSVVWLRDGGRVAVTLCSTLMIVLQLLPMLPIVRHRLTSQLQQKANTKAKASETLSLYARSFGLARFCLAI